MWNLLIAPITALVGDVLKRVLPAEKMSESEREQIASKMVSELVTGILTVVQSQASVIIAEATGQSWLQRNWRPLLMLTFTYIIAHNYIIVPILRMFTFGAGIPVLAIPPDMWDLLKLGIGGYIAGRSIEKAVEAYKK